ncbi:MAG: hypothetical protein KGL04_10355 [Elusimicrobia bacterium]|nr:hypothetical protein [Elusimicrobiota bacterium]MDE2314558.1 hypothetical protein [Elusimicrobiota bacterium]
MIVAAILSIALLQARAQSAATANESLWQLHDDFVSSTDRADQFRILSEISQTKPQSARDLDDLFDLFARYPQKETRAAAVAAINRISPDDYAFAPLLRDYLSQPDPKTQFFAILAELRLRDPKALPLIKELAEQKFAIKSAANTPFSGQRDAWWTQYEALDALAAWEGDDAFTLVKKQALAAPDVARILAARFWPKALPLFADWAASGRQNRRNAAHQGLSADVAAADLLPTRAAMLKLVLDSGEPADVRHFLALKVGLCSDDAQVAALIQKREKTADAETKLYLLGAIFASRSPKAVPLLEEDLKTNPDPAARRGALIELKEIANPADFRTLALWAAQNDADPSLRAYAQDQVSASSAAAVSPPSVKASTRAASGQTPNTPAAPR